MRRRMNRGGGEPVGVQGLRLSGYAAWQTRVLIYSEGAGARGEGRTGTERREVIVGCSWWITKRGEHRGGKSGVAWTIVGRQTFRPNTGSTSVLCLTDGTQRTQIDVNRMILLFFLVYSTFLSQKNLNFSSKFTQTSSNFMKSNESFV